jgi:hypothetical protein
MRIQIRIHNTADITREGKDTWQRICKNFVRGLHSKLLFYRDRGFWPLPPFTLQYLGVKDCNCMIPSYDVIILAQGEFGE